VQAARWSPAAGGGGYIYSFNGPHSLFVDTIRTLRALPVSHLLGHVLMGENDRRSRCSTACGARPRHREVRRLVRRGPRRLRRARPGGAREHLQHQRRQLPLPQFAAGLLALQHLDARPGVGHVRFRRATGVSTPARPRSEFWPSWKRPPAPPAISTSRIHPARWHSLLGHRRARPGAVGRLAKHAGDPFNAYEPVDSSAAAIAAQGLLRLGHRLHDDRYWQAGLAVCNTLFDEPYLSTGEKHQGLILHSVYHRPNGWDAVPEGHACPRGSLPCGATITPARWGCICCA
jgi:unsaturated chondroitin disaccharide hydrolase